MSAVIIPLPGWAVHLWKTRGGMFGIATRRGPVDPDFLPADVPLVDNHEEAFDLALSIGERTGFPVVSHVEGS
jgi:hypothetical protein